MFALLARSQPAASTAGAVYPVGAAANLGEQVAARWQAQDEVAGVAQEPTGDVEESGPQPAHAPTTTPQRSLTPAGDQLTVLLAESGLNG